MKYKVKLSIPMYGEGSNLTQFISQKNSLFSNIEFIVNNKDLEEADFWFVFEDLNFENEQCNINKENIYYLNSETSYKVDYFFENSLQKYLDQFGGFYTPYPIYRNNHKLTFPFQFWMINSNHGDGFYNPNKRNVDYFLDLRSINKTKNLSVFCSNKINTEYQHLRFKFVENLKSHFGDQLDWYGNGVNQLETKWEGIKDYRYHIAIENNPFDYCLSEKIYDAFLGMSYPIYFGGKVANKIFPNDSYSSINIFNVDKSIREIELILENKIYEDKKSEILEAKKLVCSDLNPLYRIKNIIENSQINKNKNKTTLYNKNYFYKKYTPYKKKVKRVISRKLRIN